MKSKRKPHGGAFKRKGARGAWRGETTPAEPTSEEGGTEQREKELTFPHPV